MMTVASRLRNDAESSLVAMIASIREISQRVIQLWCRCAAEVNTSFSGQPSDRSNTPAIISLLRRACQISGVLRRHNFKRSATPMPRDAVRRIGTEPAGAKHFRKFRRHHAVGRGDAGIAPVQIRHDQLQIAWKFVLDRHVGLRFARFPIRNIKHSGQFACAETPSSPRPR